MSAKELLSLCAKTLCMRNSKLIISFGRPSKGSFEKMIQQLKKLIIEHKISFNRIYLRLEQQRDVEYAQKAIKQANIIYHATGSKPSVEETLPVLKVALEYCKQNGIGYVYLSNNVYEKEYHQLCTQYGVKFYTGTCVLTDKIITNIKNGAALTGSQYYDVKYLKRLTR